jgi:putative hydrolase of the HAD superfamily
VTLLTAVVIDWGGVITQPIRDAVTDWIVADNIDWDSYVRTVVPWLNSAYESGVLDEQSLLREPAPAAAPAPVLTVSALSGPAWTGNPVHALERGECTVAEFEELLAARLLRLDGAPVPAEGLLTRMLATGRPLPEMYELVRDLRARGVRTALLSNSWGPMGYPREDFPGLFDAVVISGDVGMRKPEPEIFLHAAELLDVLPRECVFVDDIAVNVLAAEALGMTGVQHADPAATRARLDELFGNR